MDIFNFCQVSTLPQKPVSSALSYHHKCHPTGELLKHKARLCVDGSQQLHGRNYWET
jgi:hypothetical protein